MYHMSFHTGIVGQLRVMRDTSRYVLTCVVLVGIWLGWWYSMYLPLLAQIQQQKISLLASDQQKSGSGLKYAELTDLRNEIAQLQEKTLDIRAKKHDSNIALRIAENMHREGLALESCNIENVVQESQERISFTCTASGTWQPIVNHIQNVTKIFSTLIFTRVVLHFDNDSGKLSYSGTIE